MKPRARRPANHLDPDTVRRLLDGMEPDDAPPGYAPVAEVLRAAGGPPDPAELEVPGDFAARLAVALDNGVEPPRERASIRRPVRAGMAGLAAGVVLLGGVTAAGALPAPAQHLAAATLARFGISVPEPPSVDLAPTGAGDHSEPTHESSSDKGGDADADAPASTSGPTSSSDSALDAASSPGESTHSSANAASDPALSTEAPDSDHGDDGSATSGEASNDNSHAGDPPGQNKPADPTPNSRLDPPGHTKDNGPPSSNPPQGGGNSGKKS